MAYSARLARADRLVMHAGEVPAFHGVEAELPDPLLDGPRLPAWIEVGAEAEMAGY
jgi:hypothetical protein